MRWHEQPSNKALKQTKPAKVRAPLHSAAQDGAPCRVARSSLMWASQLIWNDPCQASPDLAVAVLVRSAVVVSR